MSREYNQALHALPEKRDRTIISHEKMKEKCEIIKQLIHKLGFFKDGFTFDYKIDEVKQRSKPVIQVTFYINDINNIFCTTIYTSNSNLQLQNGHIMFVKSKLGYHTGVFLFNIQLILCYLTNIPEVILENYTDDRLRAAKGIYKRFMIDKRGHSPNEYKGKNFEAQLHTSEDHMRLPMTSDLLQYIIQDLHDISEKAEVPSNTNPWNPEYSRRLTTFISSIKQYFGGSRRRVTIRHMKRRQTKNNRKSRRRVRK